MIGFPCSAVLGVYAYNGILNAYNYVLRSIYKNCTIIFHYTEDRYPVCVYNETQYMNNYDYSLPIESFMYKMIK